MCLVIWNTGFTVEICGMWNQLGFMAGANWFEPTKGSEGFFKGGYKLDITSYGMFLLPLLHIKTTVKPFLSDQPFG